MDKEILKITDVLRLPVFSDDLMFILSKKNRNILAHHNLKEVWVTNEKDYNCNVFIDNIITANLKIYDLKGDTIYKHDDYGNYHFVLLDSANGLSIWKTIDEEKETVLYHIFDIKKKTFIKKYIDSKIPLFFICQDCFVCRNSIAEVSVFNFKIQKQLWQKDLSEITSYTDWDGEHKGEIYNVYSYKNRIIVVAGNSVLSLEKDNGVIEWQTTYDDFQPHTLHIVENIGYLCRGAYYSLINLNTGEKLLEIKLLRPFNLSLKYKNSNVAMVRSDMTYHEGYFYFTDKSEEHRYLGKIEPQTGIVEEYQILEGITSSIHPPKFHKDKMFLLDSESNLHIYQKDKTLES